MSNTAYCPHCGAALPGVSAFADGPFLCQSCGASFERPSPAPSKPFAGHPTTNPYAPPLTSGYAYPLPGAWPPGAMGTMHPEQWEQAYAEARRSVVGPAISMLFGGLLYLAGGLCLAGLAIHMATTESPEEWAPFFLAGIGAALLFVGAYFCFASWRLKSLRSYRLVLGAVVLLMIVTVLTAVPLIVLAIWPMIVVSRSEIRMFFDKPAKSRD
jgi:hypothetical protein